MFSDGTCVTADSKEEAKDIFKKSSKFTKMIGEQMLKVCTEGAKIDADFQGKGTIAKFVREYSAKINDVSASVKFEGAIQEDDSKSTIDVSVKVGNTEVYKSTLSGDSLKDDLVKDCCTKIANVVIALQELNM